MCNSSINNVIDRLFMASDFENVEEVIETMDSILKKINTNTIEFAGLNDQADLNNDLYDIKEFFESLKVKLTED